MTEQLKEHAFLHREVWREVFHKCCELSSQAEEHDRKTMVSLGLFALAISDAYHAHIKNLEDRT